MVCYSLTGIPREYLSLGQFITDNLKKSKTMKRILPVIMVLLMVSSAYANGIEGTWKTNIQGPNGDMELTFVFKMADGKLSGVVRSLNGDIEITNPKVNGKEFSFDVSFDNMTIKHDCTLQNDDTINMKATGTPAGDTALILKRQV